MVDIIKAVRALLLVDTAVAAQVGTRVFGLELPKSEAASMPRKCVVLSMAGGLGAVGASDYVDVTTIRFDVFNYGLDAYETVALQRVTHDAMKGIKRNLQSSVLLHGATQSGGPIYFRDQDTDWPATVESWSVFASELTAA